MSTVSRTERSQAHGRNLKDGTYHIGINGHSLFSGGHNQLVITHHYIAIRPRHGRDVSGEDHSDNLHHPVLVVMNPHKSKLQSELMIELEIHEERIDEDG